MIVVTRPDGSRIAINADLIEHVQSDSPTVIVMSDGPQHEVTEDLDLVVAKVREYRASVMALADHLEVRSNPRLGHAIRSLSASNLRAVPDPDASGRD